MQGANMANVYTLQNIKGHRLGSIREELEKKIHDAIKSKAEINNLSEKLQDKYIKRVKAFDRERKGWNRDSLRNNTEIQKLRTHALQVINENKQLQNENTNLISHNAQKDIFVAESKAENATKSKKIRSLESMIKILEGKLSSAQKDAFSIQNNSTKKESEILSLKSKMTELEQELASTVNELERLKSEGISKPIVGGDDEKNITKSDNISLGSTDISKYFVCRKNMDQAGKIDTIIPDYTDDESTPIPKSPRVNTEIIPKVSDEIDISKTNKDIFPTQEIMNVAPYLAQPENNTPSLIRSHPQISVGGIEAIPATARTLMSLLSAYMLLALLIIAVVWFVRRTWGFERKSDRLRDAWTRY
ncbi:6830_t:CDS:1 [Entrophospora sp. SA101]|nr:9499_t:CDS:1 [Entrophospora sp. SA101]CAJ0845526.1 6830_t:CDS:1 [Entrophospora sp. SA101]